MDLRCQFIGIAVFLLSMSAPAFDERMAVLTEIPVTSSQENLAEASIITGYFAKEICSCIFVTEHSEEYCREHQIFGDLKNVMSEIKVDQQAKTVTATTSLVIIRRAEYQSEKLGCRLVSER